MFQAIFLFSDLILIKQNIIPPSTPFFSWGETGGGKKRIASKSSIFFHPFVIEFFWFV